MAIRVVNRVKYRNRGWLAAARHPTRRDGVIALALFSLPLLVMLILLLARRPHHLDGGTIATVISLAIGLPSLWLAWATYRRPRPPDVSQEQLVNQLAAAVGAQWEAEAGVRRLNDPYPLPVSWEAADPTLTDAWELLVKMALSSAGSPAAAPPNAWATGPDSLAGTGNELVGMLARVPTGRLVVLGEPGSGKTMLMVRLVLDLLARRAPGGAVPVLVSVASWNPTELDLREWLATRLVTDYPALAEAPGTGTEPTRAAALLAARLIMPILDGLDEIPDAVRGPALSRINEMLRPGEPLVLTCRSKQYQETVRPADGAEVTLRGAAAVQLLPLSPGNVRQYLCDDAAGPVARSRWQPVIDALGTGTPAGEALRTPLMVGLARTVYSPRPGEHTADLRNPAELCDPGLTSKAAVESLLFDAFIPAVYRRGADRWKVRDAQRWLVFLAQYLDRTVARVDLAWWQLPGAARVFRFWAALVAGIASGAVVWFVCDVGSIGFHGTQRDVLVFPTGILIWAGLGLADEEPSHGLRLSARPFAAYIGLGVVVGSLSWLATGHIILLWSGLVAAFVAACTAGFRASSINLAEAVTPRTVLVRDRRAGLLVMFPLGVVVAFAGFPLVYILANGAPGIVPGLTVAAFGGPAIGIALSGTRTAWLHYRLVHAWLASHQQLPWRLMSFLDDAHQRGVLRQAGAVYQFRHIELQNRLASMPWRSPGVSGSALGDLKNADVGEAKLALNPDSLQSLVDPELTPEGTE